MGKTLILLKNHTSEPKPLAAITPELLYQESFFNFFMNSNLKLSSDQSKEILKEYVPYIVDSFLKDMEHMAEILLLNYELELNDTQVLEFRQIKSERDKLIYMFSSLILEYQKDIKDKGFEKALDNHAEFFTMIDMHYKTLELSKIIKITENGEACLALRKSSVI